jgi:hypothetical protein
VTERPKWFFSPTFSSRKLAGGKDWGHPTDPDRWVRVSGTKTHLLVYAISEWRMMAPLAHLALLREGALTWTPLLVPRGMWIHYLDPGWVAYLPKARLFVVLTAFRSPSMASSEDFLGPLLILNPVVLTHAIVPLGPLDWWRVDETAEGLRIRWGLGNVASDGKEQVREIRMQDVEWRPAVELDHERRPLPLPYA